MRCEVLLFAQIAEALGRDRLYIDLPEGARVSDALAMLAEEHAAIGVHRAQIAIAVNESYAHASTELADGDIIAVIPPVSGG